MKNDVLPENCESGELSSSCPKPADHSSAKILDDERIRFLIVGGFNTVIGLGWFAFFDFVIGDSWGQFGYMASLVFSYVFAIFCAYIMHRHLVFRVFGHFWVDLLRFSLVYAVSFAINVTLLPVFIEFIGFRPLPAQAITLGLVAVLSYFAHRYFSFRRSSTNRI